MFRSVPELVGRISGQFGTFHSVSQRFAMNSSVSERFGAISYRFGIFTLFSATFLNDFKRFGAFRSDFISIRSFF